MANPLYLAEVRYGRLGNAFRETDRDSNSRQEIVGLIQSGEIDSIKILEIDEDAGTCRDVTDDIMAEARFDEQLRAIRSILDDFDHRHDLRKHELRVVS